MDLQEAQKITKEQGVGTRHKQSQHGLSSIYGLRLKRQTEQKGYLDTRTEGPPPVRGSAWQRLKGVFPPVDVVKGLLALVITSHVSPGGFLSTLERK